MITKYPLTLGHKNTGMINVIELNLNGLCNLTCSFCPRSQDYPNTNQHMSEDTLDLICDQIKEIPYTVDIHLSGRGEPTLHESFDVVISKLKALTNCTLQLTTNGAKWSKWLDSIKQVDLIVYNVYSDNEEDFWLATERLENVSCKHELNLKSLDGSKRFIKTSDGSINYAPWYLTNRTGHVINENVNNAPTGHGYCFRPFEKIFINLNGDFVFCCEDWSDQPLSNIYTESIYNYYQHNSKLKEIRAELQKGRRIGACADCSYPGHRLGV